MKYRKRWIILLVLFFSSFIGGKELFASSKYLVQSGDTMWKISIKHNVQLETLLAENPQVKNPKLIYPGYIIFIPEKHGRSPIDQENRQLFELLNKERSKANLQPIQMDEKLMIAAQKKSIDMKEHEYVAHISPTYGNPKDMLEALHVPFHLVRENVGAGPKSPEEMLQTWVNSPVNYNNILDEKVTHVGIGNAKGGLHGTYWTIILIEK